jgi:hypothetical protein
VAAAAGVAGRGVPGTEGGSHGGQCPAEQSLEQAAAGDAGGEGAGQVVEALVVHGPAPWPIAAASAPPQAAQRPLTQLLVQHCALVEQE